MQVLDTKNRGYQTAEHVAKKYQEIPVSYFQKR